MEVEAEEASQGSHTRSKHITKRALKNKALTITFNEKDLSDYVTGFHKRKKKRRKEARQKLEAVERRKRIEARKKRKLEKEFALYGGPLPKDTDEVNGEEDIEEDEGSEDDEDSDQIPSVSGTQMYDNGDYKVTVTTSEIAKEEEDELHSSVKPATASSLASGSSAGAKTKKNIPVKKKLLKKVVNQRSRPKLHNKRERRMGKKSFANKKKR